MTLQAVQALVDETTFLAHDLDPDFDEDEQHEIWLDWKFGSWDDLVDRNGGFN